jgi:phenylpropionate dioxygenase-like ring-hydroxylating dioxygenase large terminal subunit
MVEATRGRTEEVFMLSATDNQTLTRVGKGTPMGEFLRRFWTPVLLSEEIPEPDSPPVRVRIFGENLVAFRDTAGEIGLLEELCPHRQTSLFFGRNEEGGLRCVYHGWKFDVHGSCLDMPTEGPESNFKDKVKMLSYPAYDKGGLIWAYLGPLEHMPPELPAFRFMDIPHEYRMHTKYLRECNFLQALDGGIDSVHTNFLHAGLDRYRRNEDFNERARGSEDLDLKYRTVDTAPQFFARRTSYGLLVASRRTVANEGNYYWRFNQFLTPWYSMTPRGGGGHAFVPIDDYNSWSFNLESRVDRPFRDDERQRAHTGIAADPDLAGGIHMNQRVPGTYRAAARLENDFLIDREVQRTKNFTGVVGTGTQDSMAQISMGAIVDRTKEHLGITDVGIIQARRLLLDEVKQLEDGVSPPEAWSPESYSVVGIQFVEDQSVTFDECIQRHWDQLHAPLTT